MLNNSWHKKEKPIQSLSGLGGGAGGALSGAAGPTDWNASGGFINNYTHPNGTFYQVHVFVGDSPFEVTSCPDTATVDFLAVGGGGGGGNSSSPGHGGNGGGGGGGYIDGNALPISKGTYVISVGKPGAAYSGPGGTGPATERNGTDSTIATPTTTLISGYAGGGAGVDPSDSVGGANPAANSPNSGGMPNCGSGGGSWGGGGAGSYGPNAWGRTSQPQHPTTYGVQNTLGEPGGSGYQSPQWSAGGGGGAGGAGQPAPSSGDNGNGGPGTSPPFGQYIVYGPTYAETYAWGGGAGRSHPAAGGGGGGDSGSPGEPSLDVGPGFTGAASMGVGGRGQPGGGTDIQMQGGGGVVALRYEIPTSAGTAKATGGVISFSPTRTHHAFFRPGSFVAGPTHTLTVDWMCIAGGGSGGTHIGGGGGAGGLLTNLPTIPGGSGQSAVTIPGGTSVSITIGGGAPGQIGSPTIGGLQGLESSIAFAPGTITCTGGGAAGSAGSGGSPGGSGGGAGQSGSAGTGTGDQGNGGGTGYPGGEGAGGGGGRGAAGQPGPGPSTAGAGGDGVLMPPAIYPSPPAVNSGNGYYWAGGGGGSGGSSGGGTGGNGGLGGGGGGSVQATGPAGSGGTGGIAIGGDGQIGGGLQGGFGANGTGGGGGGGSHPYPGQGGSGGSGIAIIVYDT